MQDAKANNTNPTSRMMDAMNATAKVGMTTNVPIVVTVFELDCNTVRTVGVFAV